MMSPYVRLLVQVLAWFFADAAAAYVIAGQHYQWTPMENAHQPSKELNHCASRSTPVASTMLCHVDFVDCAPPWSTMTSSSSPIASCPEHIKARAMVSTFSGRGSNAVMMSPYVRLLVQVLAWFFADAAAAYVIAGQHYQWTPMENAHQPSKELNHCASRSTPVASTMLCHVDFVDCAPPWSTMTSSSSPIASCPEHIKARAMVSTFSGRGSNAVMMSPYVRLLVQVGDRKYGFRSNCTCLIVLPCPHTVLGCLNDCVSVVSLLLKLSGDVEENPGPEVEKMLEEILSNQTKLLAKVNEIQAKQTSTDASISDMHVRLQTIEKQLEGLGEIQSRLTMIESSVGRHDSELTALARQIDDLDNRSRRNNLLVRGVEEEEFEDEAVLLSKVNDDIFDKLLGSKCSSIERIHRLGKKIPGRSRPVILKVGDFRDKTKILKNCRNLKGTQFSISEDYSKRVVEIRKQLWISSADERAKGAKVKLIIDKLKVNNVLYGWNEVTNERFRYASPGITSSD
ncbi:uncharacterized protein LOC119171476 [Rhipicephalus microplus]|uniref:uncharacterized protein LOC119171476 n=1 Tax=Rhipicephalus microplus TaxID=6941 RepID=UPI003F6BF980